MPELPVSPSCERNRDPILAVLREHFGDRRRVLEIGAGTGQHAVHFAAGMPWLAWQASDVAGNLDGIRLWLQAAALPNTPPPLELDVRGPWPAADFDAVFTANSLHIMGWPEVEAFFHGVDRVLGGAATPARHGASPGARIAGGALAVYGPFNYGGDYTSASNRDFDGWLKARDPRSGIRDFEAVDALARGIGLVLVADVAMPANNRTLVWRR
jgi:SAM-dependent methyltransferase